MVSELNWTDRCHVSLSGVDAHDLMILISRRFFDRMELFPEASSEFLHQLRALVAHSPIPHLDTHKLIQMLAISMYASQHSGVQGMFCCVRQRC